MTETKSKQSIPPYPPWRSFENYLDSLKAFGPELPNVIDRDSMRSYSGALQSMLLSALRSLNMIDEDGVPKPRLKQIAHASVEDRKSMYRQVLEAEYPFLKGINLQGATPKQIESAFETTGATGDTVRKCMVFFVGLAKAAGVPLSPLIVKVRRRPAKPSPNGGTTQTKKQKAEEVILSLKDDPPAHQPKPTFQVLYDLLSADMGEDEEAAIWTLLRYLKKKEAKK